LLLHKGQAILQIVSEILKKINIQESLTFDLSVVGLTKTWSAFGGFRWDVQDKECVPNVPSMTLNLSRQKGNAFYRMILQRLSKLQQVRVFEKPQGSNLSTATKVLKKIYFNQLMSRWRLLMNLLPWFHSKRISLKVSCGSYYWWDWMQIQSDGDRMPVFCSFSGNSFTCNFDRDESCNIKLLKPRYVHK